MLSSIAPIDKNMQLTKLHLSHGTMNDLSVLTLSQLLELLHQKNIRYAPDSSREELEELLHSHLSSGRQENNLGSRHRSTSRRSKESLDDRDQITSDVVDAVVVDDVNERTVDAADEYATRQRRRYQSANASKNKRARSRRRNDRRSIDGRQSRYRDQPRRSQYIQDNIIDVDFDLPDQSSQDTAYNNGLQIFLMGFMEAGKTAAELAVDAAKNTISAPFSDDTWYNEELGRDVVDANVVDYRRRYWDDERGSMSKTRMRSDRRSKVRSYSGRSRVDQYQPDGYEDGASLASSFQSQQYHDGSDLIGVTSTQTQKRQPRSRNYTNEVGKPKPVYGIGYVHDNNIKNDEETEPRIYRQLHHHKRRWKDRLRTKFDAALGLEPTAAPTEKESYYDSWKRNMREMNDNHKDRLRRKMKDGSASASTVAPFQRSFAMDPNNRVPQNRRAKMRAVKAGIMDESSSLQTSTQISAISPGVKTPRTKKYKSKLHPKEKPFWKERGSIASLLFDNSPSSWRKNMQNKNKRTLEVSLTIMMLRLCYMH